MLSAKISTEFILSIDPYPAGLFQIPTSMSESLARVIVLPSSVYPYFQPDRWSIKSRTCWTIQTRSHELNWAIRHWTFQELNSLRLVYLMKSSTFDLGLYMFLWTWRYTIFNSIPIILILLTNKIVHWIYYVKINVSIKQRIVRRKGAFKEHQLR